MAITALTITNPGAETGDTTGWTQSAGSGFIADTVAWGGGLPYAGNYMFFMGAGDNAAFYQELDVSAHAVAIDADTCAIDLKAYHVTMADSSVWRDDAALQVQFYDVSNVLISTETNAYTMPTSWTQDQLQVAVPVNTRYIRIGAICNWTDSGATQDVYWDNFTADFSDDRFADYPGVYDPQVQQIGAYAVAGSDAAEGDFEAYTSQLAAYAIANAPSEEAYANQLQAVAVGQAETDSGFHDVIAHQLAVYALVRGFPDRRDICAWTFTQDDHDFYVLQIGATSTLVYDTLTKQWSDWRSPGYSYWRAIDGCAWEGYNVAIDPLSNKIWQIDPVGRLDYETTPIRSIVTGMFTERYRKHVPIYMAELAVSETDPPTGIDASTVGISLRTYQQSGAFATDHGEVTGTDSGEDITVRWYGLGLAKAPGHVFEIIDTGYARRIDGFDVDIGDFANGSN